MCSGLYSPINSVCDRAPQLASHADHVRIAVCFQFVGSAYFQAESCNQKVFGSVLGVHRTLMLFVILYGSATWCFILTH
jgi:hypothetical protein